MEYLLYSIICAFLAFLAHSGFNYAMPQIRDKAPIYGILRQAKLISGLWILFLPLFFYLACVRRPINITIAEYPADVIYYFIGIAFFASLFFMYISLYYVADRSVSSAIMLAIENSKDKKIALDDIKKLYGIEGRYEHELRGMREGGFITEENGRYRNTLKGKIFAAYAGFFKKLYRVGLGGY